MGTQTKTRHPYHGAPQCQSVYHDALLQVYRLSSQWGLDDGDMDSRSRQLLADLFGVDEGKAVSATSEQCREVYLKLRDEYRAVFPDGSAMPEVERLDRKHARNQKIEALRAKAQEVRERKAVQRSEQQKAPVAPDPVAEHNKATLNALFRAAAKQRGQVRYTLLAMCSCGRLVQVAPDKGPVDCLCGAYQLRVYVPRCDVSAVPVPLPRAAHAQPLLV